MSLENQMKAKPKASFMAVSSGLMRRNCDKCSESNYEYQPTSRQLLDDTSAIEPPHFSHDFSQVSIGLQCKPIISQPGDALEEEADRVAEAVVGKGISEPLLTHAKGVPAIQCQGQSSPQPSPEEQYKNAAEKAGEAFLKTNLGRDIKDKALKQGKDFISTLRGKIITGAAAAGVVSTLAATNSKLPMQVPEIPLDFITPGLKVKLNYDGPVRNPTSASLTFTYVEQVQKKERKGEPTEREKFRAETARIAEDQAKFREGLKTPEQRAAEHDQFMNAYWGRKNRLGLDPVRIPSLVDDEGKKPALRMRDERPKREEEGLQRKAVGSKPLAGIPPIVHEVLKSPGQPLEPGTRAFMEERFGYDLSRVRVHNDAKAVESTQSVSAKAFTVGKDIVFDSGYYAPNTKLGKQLLAHELAHTVQQLGYGFNSGSNPALLQRRQKESVQGGSNSANTGTTSSQQPAISPESSDYSYIRVTGKLIIDGVSPEDAYQGDLGDCGIISALAAVARSEPGIITRSIRYAGPDQWWILLWHKKGKENPFFEPEWFLVNQDLPVDKSGKLAFGHSKVPLKKTDKCRKEYKDRMCYDPLNPCSGNEPHDIVCTEIPDEAKRELWPSLYEKAFVLIFSKYKDEFNKLYNEIYSARHEEDKYSKEHKFGGYAGVTAFPTNLALEIITGTPAKLMALNDYQNNDLFNQIKIALDNKQPVTASTKKLLNIGGILEDHSYSVMYIYILNKEIALRDPNYGNLTINFDKFKRGFSHVIIGGKAYWLQTEKPSK